MSLIVVCPSRNRPTKASEAYRAFLQTKELDDTRMVFVVDDDDATLGDYYAKDLPVWTVPAGQGMAGALNAVAVTLADEYDITGFVGDDHRFRTKGWDRLVEGNLDPLTRYGIVYGRDLIRDDIPTHVFIRSDIILALGWMALPDAKHLYLDNAWAELGRRAGCIVQIPEIVVEHMHPTAGKAQWDADYARVNAQHVYSHDGQVYARWIDSGRAELDAAVVRRLLA